MKYLVLLFVGFSSFIVEVNAQDTVCYKETSIPHLAQDFHLVPTILSAYY